MRTIATTNTAETSDNRLRFGIRVIDAVRDRVGSEFIVGIRVTGDDFTERGLDNPQMLADL